MFGGDLLDLIETQQHRVREEQANRKARLVNVVNDEILLKTFRDYIGKVKETFNPRGFVIPRVLPTLSPVMLDIDMVLKTKNLRDRDLTYFNETVSYRHLFKEQFKRNYINITEADKKGDLAKIMANNDAYTEMLDKLFSEEGDINMPVVFDYNVGLGWSHVFMLLRKSSPSGTIIEVFDPNGNKPTKNAVRKDINDFIQRNITLKGLKVEFNIAKLQSSKGVQCARLCWLRWYTFNNGFDGAAKEEFYSLHGFTDYFTTHFKTHKEIEKAAVATMMAEGIDDNIVEGLLGINITKTADIEAQIKEGERKEEELAHKHKAATRERTARLTALSSRDDGDDDELAALVEVPVMPPRRHEGGGRARGGDETGDDG
jgi:hypothetical protein